MQAIQSFYLRHRDFLTVLVLFIAFRAMTLVMSRPGGYVVDWNDYYFFKGWAQLTDFGNFPYFDFWMEHPPLFPWLVVLAYKLSILIPPWNDPNLAFSLVFGMILLPFEIGNLVLVYLIGKRFLPDDVVIRACWIYSSLFIPVFFWTAGFDAYPLFFLLLSLLFALRGNAAMAGISTGFGFMVKVLPLLAVPAAIATLGNQTRTGSSASSRSHTESFRNLANILVSRKALVYVCAVAFTTGTIAIPFILVNRTMFVASFQGMINRSSWETIWALLDGYYGGGGVADPATRFDPATALLQTHPSALPWVWLSVAFAALYLFLWTRHFDWRNSRTVVAFAGLTVNVFLLYSKGFSPQFLVYVLPFIVLLMPGLRGIAYALLLSFINIAEYPVALVILPESHWLLAITVLARTGVILALSCEFLGIALDRSLLPRSHAFRLALVGFIGACIIVTSAGIARDYSSSRLNKNPYKEAIDYLSSQPRSTVLFTDVDAYRQFSPYVDTTHKAELIESAQMASDFAKTEGSLWIVYLGTDRDATLNPGLESTLSVAAFQDNLIWFKNSRLTHYTAGDLQKLSLTARFGNLIELLSAGMSPDVTAEGPVRVQFEWRATQIIPDDYQVFVHLIDAEGKLVAQKDGTPVNGQRPTTTWPAGASVIDNVAVVLPPTTRPGTYTLRVGFYNSSSGNRLITDTGSDHAEIRGLRILAK